MFVNKRFIEILLYVGLVLACIMIYLVSGQLLFSLVFVFALLVLKSILSVLDILHNRNKQYPVFQGIRDGIFVFVLVFLAKCII